MLKSFLNLDGVMLLSKEQQKKLNGGDGLVRNNPGLQKPGFGGGGSSNQCVSSNTCTEGCEIIDQDGCSTCSGCCIA